MLERFVEGLEKWSLQKPAEVMSCPALWFSSVLNNGCLWSHTRLVTLQPI